MNLRDKFKQKPIQKTFIRKEFEFEEIPARGTDKGRIYDTPHGPMPSVTTILSARDTSGLDEWRKAVGEETADRITKEACDRGSAVHDIIERYLRGEEIVIRHPALKEHFLQVKKYLDKLGTIYANEIPLYSKHLGVAGRCDCIADVDGKMSIVDFKTSKHFKTFDAVDSYKMQCSAYAWMVNEMFGTNIVDFTLIISNLYENECTIYHGNAKDYIKDFWELKKKWTTMNQ